ncbi:MAG: PD-(D/E)XK nuclease family protein [Deltaproteobacteria bacterium]|nr:PD-(D/E)XK nuclease family protein [Deltaproteobacteria bacterium]
MPVHLYHGPPSHAKRHQLVELVKKGDPSSQDYLVVVPDKNAVLQHKSWLLDQQTPAMIMGRNIITWNDFLLQSVKQHTARVHVADKDLCLYLLYLLCLTRFPGLFNKTPDPLKKVHEFYCFFNQIKSCGLGPEAAEKIFNEHITTPHVFDLFKSYQDELRKRHYFDMGDLSLETLKIIKDGHFTIQPKRTLYISGIYPLKPGHREIIRKLKEYVPGLDIHIFYDEEFAQQTASLSNIYEDLGSLSDDSLYINTETQNTHSIYEFKTPFHEIEWICQEIKKQIQAGTSPADIAVVVPSHDYTTPLSQRLFENNIPVACQTTQNHNLCPLFLLKTQAAKTQSVSQEKEAPSFQKETLLKIFRDQNNYFTAQKLRSHAAVEDTLSRFTFIDELLRDLSSQISHADKKVFLQEHLNQLTIPPDSLNEQLVITNIDGMHGFWDRHLFFPGLNLENLSKALTPSFFSPYLYTKKDFAEILESPSYRLKTALEKTKHLSFLARSLIFTRAHLDFGGKPTTSLALAQGPLIPGTQPAPVPTDTPAAQPAQPKTADYFKSKKKAFSISQLQEYITCPYRYYAACRLRLGAVEREEYEPKADAKGSFVHRVLQRLIKENESDYIEGLEYKSYRDKLGKRLGFIIQQEIDKDEIFKKYNSSVVEFYAWRCYKTILEMINIEAQNFHEEKKKTAPKHYEWAFGDTKTNPFDILIEGESIGIRGRIDRIDINRSKKNFSVIDYKTGNVGPISDIKSGTSLQLPLYLMAVQKNLYPDYTPAGAYYYMLKKNEIKGISFAASADANLMHKRSQITLDDWESIQVAVKNRIADAVKGIHQGLFDPAPLDDNTCHYCDYKRICGYV